jgi:hypothetical protein
MADLFINKLDEASIINNGDFVPFDVVNTSNGAYTTKKVTYATIVSNLSSDVYNLVSPKLVTLQNSINATNSLISSKLDKLGTDLNSNEKMGGPLVTKNLTSNGYAHFTKEVNLKNNKIINLANPVSDYDAVNLKTLMSKVSTPSTSNYLSKTGDSMTAGYLTLFLDPIDTKHAATKYYVDSKYSHYIPLSGGTMTSGFITAATDSPLSARHLVTKKYVDDSISSAINGATPPTIDTSAFLKKDGSVSMDFAKTLTLGIDPTNSNHAVNKGYLDNNFLKLTGGTMTGGLVLKNFSEKTNSITGTGGLILSLNDGNTFPISLTGNVTSITLNNVPSDSVTVTLFITQTGTFNITWVVNGSTVKWAGGSTPIVTASSGRTDVFCLTKVGAIWYGFIGGQNF